jgi:hypothetical protein
MEKRYLTRIEWGDIIGVEIKGVKKNEESN